MNDSKIKVILIERIIILTKNEDNVLIGNNEQVIFNKFDVFFQLLNDEKLWMKINLEWCNHLVNNDTYLKNHNKFPAKRVNEASMFDSKPFHGRYSILSVLETYFRLKINNFFLSGLL